MTANFYPVARAFRTFPKESRSPKVIRSIGPHLELADGSKYVDLTAGTTGFAILGGGVRAVIDAMASQLEAYPHADYKYFEEPARDELSRLLLPNCPGGLDRVLFSGGSGSEACEMALQLSFQVHKENGESARSWAIGTRQSYHGSTTGALALGERPNLEFFQPILPHNRLRIQECNYRKHALPGESVSDYSFRAASMLETAVLSIGPERVACFLGETMLGGLVGDVPATEGYWKHIRDICDRYGIHLILDEVWCGGGVTGKRHCFEWEQVSPDIVFTGKTIAGGYAPISLVLTRSEFEDCVGEGSGRLEISCTFQGHSVATAAAIATQRLIEEMDLLERSRLLGEHTRQALVSELGKHPFVADIRGRGIRTTIAYECPESHLFGQCVARILKDKHQILVSGKWHRLSLTHSMLIKPDILNNSLEKVIATFKEVAGKWNKNFYMNLNNQPFF